MYGAMEESTPAAAPALGPAELKAVRKLLSTTSSSIGGSDVTRTARRRASSTYPDFDPFCGEAGGCGNTCCVPSDEWDGARAAAGD